MNTRWKLFARTWPRERKKLVAPIGPVDVVAALDGEARHFADHLYYETDPLLFTGGIEPLHNSIMLTITLALYRHRRSASNITFRNLFEANRGPW